MGPVSEAPALILPISLVPPGTTTSSASTASAQPLFTSASGNAADIGVATASVQPLFSFSVSGSAASNAVVTVTTDAQIRIVVLAPDASMDPPATGGAAGALNSQTGDPAGLRRLVALGDIASLQSSRAVAPVDFGVEGQPIVANQTGSNAPSSGSSTDAALATSSSDASVVDLPADPRLQVAGTFSPNNGTLDFRVPIDAATQAVRFVLRPQPDQTSGPTAALGNLTLIAPSGATLAEIEPGPNPDTASPEDLTVSMVNPPAGGQLVLRVTGVPPAQTAAGSVSPSTNQSSVPFLLDIQRQDRPQTEESAATPAEAGWFGTFATTSAGQASPSPQEVNPAATGATASNVASNDQTTEIPIVSTPLSGASDDGYYVRMATGPLVSRSSGPLGPVLATSDSDPTPPVDRHERALAQEISTVEREGESASSVHSFGRRQRTVAQVDDLIARSEPGERAVTVVLGAGGFPMKVSSQSSGGREGSAALLAALPVSAAPGSTDALPGSFAATENRSVALAAQVSYPAERREYPDYLKAACGLVLGLGLTSGPLFSDLITSLRKRSPRWLGQSLAGSGADGSPVRRRLRVLLAGLLGRAR